MPLPFRPGSTCSLLTASPDRNTKMQPFAVHYFVQADIEVRGDQAVGKWYEWLTATQADGRAVWTAGIEDEKYRKVNGEWLISETKLTPIFRTPYEEGWHKVKFCE